LQSLNNLLTHIPQYIKLSTLPLIEALQISILNGTASEILPDVRKCLFDVSARLLVWHEATPLEKISNTVLNVFVQGMQDKKREVRLSAG
jgi:hypothetical protein